MIIILERATNYLQKNKQTNQTNHQNNSAGCAQQREQCQVVLGPSTNGTISHPTPPLLSAPRPKREHNPYLLCLISTTAKVKWCTEILIPDRNITRFSVCHCNSNTPNIVLFLQTATMIHCNEYKMTARVKLSMSCSPHQWPFTICPHKLSSIGQIWQICSKATEANHHVIIKR